ncbi:MAG: prepilin-type N-terminal cleavage/methylation domain-containing protein [Pseudomonas sp.]|nr:prepilin-type N-terminal cleavage/methylation domain-containing protein [Pseudomonas sp.]MDZ4190962.1 prepilin-type N-terminal cleavage/methylation domain-containing protein [Pseudomonas sp.]
MRRQRGFTLIEVMVAVLLMAIVSLLAWRGLNSVSRADAHLQDASEQHAALLRALNQMQRDFDLRASTELAEPARPDNQEAAIRHKGTAVSVRGSDSNPLRLELVRVAAAQDGKIQRVSWWVNNGVLYRASGAPRARYPLPAPRDSVAVLDNLQKVQVRIWRADRGWMRLAGSKEENPAGLELSFERRTDQGIERYRKVLGPLEH